MVISQAMILPPSSLKSDISLSNEATLARFMRRLIIHFPRPSRCILDSGPLSRAPLRSRWSPQKVKYIETSMPMARAPLPTISAL
jgi:hypothetical protein